MDECVHLHEEWANLLFCPVDFGVIDAQHVESALKFFLDKGSDIECRSGDNLIPLLFATCSTWPSSLPCLSFFLEHGANILAVDHEGRGALHLMASTVDEICDHWYERHGRRSSCDPDLCYCSFEDVENKFVKLLQAGCNPLALDDEGRPPSWYINSKEEGWLIWVSALEKTGWPTELFV